MILELLFISAILGAIFGSFINASVYRMAKKESLQGRSHCVHCTYQLKWYDLVPVGSFVVLKGKCRSCNQSIPKHYFFVEAVLAFLFCVAALFWAQQGGDLQALSLLALVLDWFILSVLVFLFVFDAKYLLLPDKVTLPAIAIVTIGQLVLGKSWQNLLLGLTIGAGFFLLQFVLSKGKWIGGGDIRLGALMGVILGWPLILIGLFIAYVTGALFSLPLLLAKKKQMGSQIPFGTFLALATVFTMYWGQDALDWYLTFL